MNITLPEHIHSLELFRDSEGRWCGSVNYLEKYCQAGTPGEALELAIAEEQKQAAPNHKF